VNNCLVFAEHRRRHGRRDFTLSDFLFALTDDVQDAFLAILTNGKVTEDKVGSHDDLLTEFPYVGPPHKA